MPQHPTFSKYSPFEDINRCVCLAYLLIAYRLAQGTLIHCTSDAVGAGRVDFLLGTTDPLAF
jgi:hypothetical protein